MHKNLPKVEENADKAFDLKKFLNSKKVVVIITVFIIVFAIAGVFCFIGISSASKSAYESYQDTLTEQRNSIKNEYLDTVRQIAEERYHVSNDVEVNIKFAEDVSRLEVLKVYDTEYAIHDGNEKIWTEIPGEGIFTVDLKNAEIITDSKRGYVLVRVLKPEMTSFDLDYANAKILLNENTNFLPWDNGSVKLGEELARKDLAEAERNIQNRMLNNLDYYNSAEKLAQEMIKDLLNSLNPERELIVDVEFVELSKE